MPTTVGATVLRDSYPPKDIISLKASRCRRSDYRQSKPKRVATNFRGNMSSSGWSGMLGQTKNPRAWSQIRGSSSGSGVAAAANLCAIAIGTETNGSIVCPSNNNGLVGLKPTVGLISRSGIIPISSTQDTAELDGANGNWCGYYPWSIGRNWFGWSKDITCYR